MKQNELKITYKSFSSLSELSSEDKELIEAASKAAAGAYAIYSNFNVGAALLLENGEIISGSNQENSAYPSGLCAERVALFYAGSKYPNVAIKKMAITTNLKDKSIKAVANPCGACRQVISQSTTRQGKPFNIILAGEDGSGYIFDSIESLLPFAFKL